MRFIILLPGIVFLASGCATTNSVEFNDKTEQVDESKCESDYSPFSILEEIGFKSKGWCPTSGQEQLRFAAASKTEAEAGLLAARSQATIARSAQYATITRIVSRDGTITEMYEARKDLNPELVRALASLEAADTSDENTLVTSGDRNVNVRAESKGKSETDVLVFEGDFYGRRGLGGPFNPLWGRRR